MTRRDPLLIFFALLLAYCYVLPRWADWSQNSRINLVRALVEQNTVQIDAYVANTGDYALYNGHAYTDKAPGPALLGLPVYAAALPLIDQPAVAGRLERLAGGGAMAGTLNPNGTGLNTDKIRHFVAQVLLTATTVALPAAGLGALLYCALARLGFRRGLRLLVTLGYGLATPAAIYAGNFYSHQLVAALLFGAFFLLTREELSGPNAPASADRSDEPAAQHSTLNTRNSTLAPALLAGLLCGFAVISEYPSALVAAGLGLYALLRLPWRATALMVLGGLLPVALMGLYDLRAFGTVVPVGYGHSALWQDQHHTGFLSITYPRPEALWGLTFGAFRGLFVRAPWLVAAAPGFVLWWRSGQARAALWLALWACLCTLLFYSSSVMWWGGFGVGPRYIVPMLPFLALAAAFGLRPPWESAAGRAGALALVALSAGLVWAEGLAFQGFPPDSIRQPWIDYTAAAWREGNIARNLGTALGLRGGLSILPLLVALGVLVGFMVGSKQVKVGSERNS
ncbi:MAG TPA: hypothetical protein VFS21_39445 [Roseiflexaceae bacterium]|nr:hypothetical protein [Roseiflexaceae bacterium]